MLFGRKKRITKEEPMDRQTVNIVALTFQDHEIIQFRTDEVTPQDLCRYRSIEARTHHVPVDQIKVRYEGVDTETFVRTRMAVHHG